MNNAVINDKLYKTSCYITGDASQGIVQAFVEEKDGLANAWVRVKWDIGHDVKEYRFGVGGYVDVVASKVTQSGKVYNDHLPVIGLFLLCFCCHSS